MEIEHSLYFVKDSTKIGRFDLVRYSTDSGRFNLVRDSIGIHHFYLSREHRLSLGRRHEGRAAPHRGVRGDEAARTRVGNHMGWFYLVRDSTDIFFFNLVD